MTPILERDTLNAFCHHTHVAVAGASRGPLVGLTFGAKDIYDVAGHKTGFGNPDWLATHAPAAKTASVVERLLDAGATLVGKTHTEEFAFSITGNNAHYGRPVNSRAPGRLSGGSSSGSAAAVAGGLCDFALAADTGGSARLPASFCGIYGMRTTHGRIALDGTCVLAPSFDACGWFARDMDVFVKVAGVLLGGEPGPGGDERLLMAEDAFALLERPVMDAFAPALERTFKVLGTPQSVIVSAEGLRAWFEIFRTVQFGEIWREHGEWIERVRPRFGPGIKERIEIASKLDPSKVAAARGSREDIAKRMAALVRGRVILVLPTVPGIAPLVDTPLAELEDFRSRTMSLLCIASLARLPEITMPLGVFEDCPLGLSLIGPAGGEETLIAAAARITASR